MYVGVEIVCSFARVSRMTMFVKLYRSCCRDTYCMAVVAYVVVISGGSTSVVGYARSRPILVDAYNEGFRVCISTITSSLVIHDAWLWCGD